MREKQLAISLVIGLGLVALSMVPGLFQMFQDSLENFSQSLRGAWPSQFPRRQLRQIDYAELPRPAWLALLGVGLILLGSLNYIFQN